MNRFFMALARYIPVGVRLPILTGPLRGKWWISGAAAGEGRGLSVLIHRMEPAQTNKALELCQEGSTCFDIGANVGFYSLLWSEKASRVFAFEPSVRNLMYLRAILKANRVDNVKIVSCAISDTCGVALFEDGRNPAEGTLNDQGTQPVATVTIDRFVDETGVKPQLIKIDVEGAEEHVLRGAERVLKSCHPTLLLSVHGPELRMACLSLLKTWGYDEISPLDQQYPDSANEFVIWQRNRQDA